MNAVALERSISASGACPRAQEKSIACMRAVASDWSWSGGMEATPLRVAVTHLSTSVPTMKSSDLIRPRSSWTRSRERAE